MAIVNPPRTYMINPRRAATGPSGFERAFNLGSQICGDIGNLIGLPAQIQQQQNQDAAANALMNQNDPAAQPQPVYNIDNPDYDPNDPNAADPLDISYTPGVQHTGGTA